MLPEPNLYMSDYVRAEMLRSIHKNLALLNGVDFDDEEWKTLGQHAVERLWRELRLKEAAGVGVRIDTETLDNYEILAETPCPPQVYYDDDNDNDNDDELKALKEELNKQKKTAKANFEQCLTLMRGQIEDLCSRCSHCRSIRATEEGIRCDCLSEHFFLHHLQRKCCSLKDIR